MFSNRFLTILVLLIYGVPSAIGPHWHHHDRSCSHVDAPGAGNTCAPSDSHGDCHEASASSGKTTANHCCCHRESPYRKGAETHEHRFENLHPSRSDSDANRLGDGWSGVSEDCGLCAICLHQAQSQVVAASIALDGFANYLFTIDFRADSADCLSFSLLRTRAPPAIATCS
ncbi:hypothetical protein [Pirellula sp. SH-Sr6A]|uniref:hypothetical protein n=1 Tax=Pirellula sp. SH-Sr6A TaxID=1632865 RepID=UPI0011BAA786|nr:hypothetical protein [Pirellula sp. SH-Sr6A]